MLANALICVQYERVKTQVSSRNKKDDIETFLTRISALLDDCLHANFCVLRIHLYSFSNRSLFCDEKHNKSSLYNYVKPRLISRKKLGILMGKKRWFTVVALDFNLSNWQYRENI